MRGRCSCIFLEEKKKNIFWLLKNFQEHKSFERVKRRGQDLTGVRQAGQWWSADTRGHEELQLLQYESENQMHYRKYTALSCRSRGRVASSPLSSRGCYFQIDDQMKNISRRKLPKKFPTWMMQCVMLFRQRPYTEASQHPKHPNATVELQSSRGTTSHFFFFFFLWTSDCFMTENHLNIDISFFDSFLLL